MPWYEDRIALPGEIDSYRLTLTAGVTYWIEVRPQLLLDTYVSLYQVAAPADVLLAFDDDGGNGTNSRLLFTPTVTQDYRIDVRAFSSAATGGYALTVFQDDFRNSLDGVGPAGSIAMGGTARGTINYVLDNDFWQGDADAFQVNLIGGLSYTFSLLGASGGGGTLQGVFLSVLDPSANVLVQGGAAVTASSISLTVAVGATGFYTLLASEATFGLGGTYTVAVSGGTGTAAADIVTGLGTRDIVALAAGDDVMDGKGGDDDIRGEAGHDTLSGGIGNDLLSGGSQGDELRGQDGNDRLVGGTGADVLVGGRGRDVFVFESAAESSPFARDVILAGDRGRAFDAPGAAAGDIIDLRLIDADTTAAGDQAFVFGTATGKGRLWMANSGTFTVLFGNVDGDADPEFEVLIEDGVSVTAATYSAADFLL